MQLRLADDRSLDDRIYGVLEEAILSGGFSAGGTERNAEPCLRR